jgi:hypothetical protein
MDALSRAVDLLAAGDWEAAHAIVDRDPTPLGSWLHGIVHTLEGDLSNARYWYGRAGRDFPGAEHVADEIAAARRAVEGRGGSGVGSPERSPAGGQGG